jgi:hypothetical protein
MAVMWSLWGSSNIKEWLFLLSKIRIGSGQQFRFFLGIFTLFIAGALILQWAWRSKKVQTLVLTPPQNTKLLTSLSLGILFFLSSGIFTQYLPSKINRLNIALSEDKKNENDERNLETGYYKNLLDGENGNSGGMWEVNLKFSKQNSEVDKLIIRREGILSRVLKPNSKALVDGYLVETDSFGLRDQEYARQRPVHTFRFALLGASYELGAGVPNDAVFKNAVAANLNRMDTNSVWQHFEIMNFAMYRYHLIQHVELCNTKIFGFQPNAVMYFAHTDEQRRFLNILTEYIRNGTDLKYPFLKDIKKRSGVRQSMSNSEIQERLKPYGEAMIVWCYTKISESCRQNKAIPIWVYLPTTSDPFNLQEFEQLRTLAQKLNYVVLDLRNVYGSAAASEIQISKTNVHPNRYGHALIAKKLFEEIEKHKSEIMR